MDNSRPSEESIFVNAIERPPGESRDRFVEEACAGDMALRRNVEALLREHEASGDLLDRIDARSADSDAEEGMSLAGTEIGPYKLRELIGEGGFGMVYVAEQLEPIRRTVALKVIKPGMDTQEVIARFEAERQALAIMDHPHIAKVLDAGTMKTGRPYFVMELVNGVPLGAYCDEARLSVPERLRLFTKVCYAVQHAHQKGVIHRDLKPSNVLVTLNDGVAVPKVIDFGIAKALHEPLTEKSVYTRWAHWLGTPLYMSPEQAAHSGLDIDTRTDVYSLGVLLYELLTGTTPLDRGTLQRVDLDETRRIIRDVEPPRPSDRISTLSNAYRSAVCERRRVDARQLRNALNGDLDWVVMRALEKDRERRYSTASEFAMDIERHLAGKAVEAGRPTRAYRIRKLIARHRLAIGVSLTIAASLLTGFTVAVAQLARANRQRVRAVQAEALAAERLKTVEREQAKTELALAQARSAEEEQRRLREEAEARDRYSRQLLYASDIGLAARALVEDDVSGFMDVLSRQDADLQGFEWRFLRRFGTAPRRDLHGRGGGACLARSFPQANLLVTGHYSGRLYLFDSRSEELLRTLPGHASFANGADLSPDGKTLATTGDDGMIRLWDVATGNQLAAFRSDSGHGHRVYFAKNGEVLLSSGEEPKVKIWDSRTHALLGELGGFAETPHHGVKQRLARSGDGSRCAAADGFELARVYDVSSRRILARLDLEAGGYVRCLRMSPDGRLVAGGRETQEVTLWEAETGDVVRRYRGHLDDVQDLAFHPGGEWLATCDKSGVVRVWSLGEAAADAPPPWPAHFLGHDDRIWSLAFSPTGDRLVTASRDGVVRVWPKHAQPLHTFETAELEVRAAWLSPDTLAVTQDDRLTFWNVDSGEKTTSPAFNESIPALSASPDRRLFATGHVDGTLRLWNADKRAVLDEWTGHDDKVQALAFSHDGQRLVSADSTGAVHVWDLATKDRLRTFSFDYPCISVALDPTDRFVAMAVQDDVYLADLHDDARPRRLKDGHGNSVDCVAFDPSGARLVSGSDDRTIRVWEMPSGELQHVVRGHKQKIESIAFSPDGKTLVSGDKEGLIAFTHVATGRFLFTFDVKRYWPDANIQTAAPWVSDLNFSPDGKRLSVGVFRVGVVVLDDGEFDPKQRDD